jgi:hypothetical protein
VIFGRGRCRGEATGGSMARVGSVNLEVILSGDSDALLEGSWTIEFSAFDVSSNLE